MTDPQMPTPLSMWLTITRPQGGNAEGIHLCVEDVRSHTKFLELTVPYAEFAQALTGLANVLACGTVRHLDRVGRRVEVRQVSLRCPLPSHTSRGRLEAWLREHGHDGEWRADAYLGEQGSVRSDGDGCQLRYYQRRYVVEENP